MYTYTHHPRSKTTLGVLCVIWVALFSAWFWLEAAPWVLVILGAFTLPAVYDLAANPAAGTTLSADTLSWHAGRATGDIALNRIHHIRLDTRLDLSVRATVVLTSGVKIKIPVAATPPHRPFEQALQSADVTVLRHHFSLIQ